MAAFDDAATGHFGDHRIGHDGLVSLFGVAGLRDREQPDDETHQILGQEGADEHGEVDGGIGTAGEFAADVGGEPGKGQHRDLAEGGDHQPGRKGEALDAQHDDALRHKIQEIETQHDLHGADAAAAQPVGDDTHRQDAHHEGHCHEQQMMRDLGPCEAHDIAQPGTSPERLDADLHAGGQAEKRRDAPEQWRLQDRQHLGELLAERGGRGERIPARGHPEDQQRSQQDQPGKDHEGRSPANEGHEIFSGFGCHHDTQRAHRHDARIGQRPALGRHPGGRRLVARHQTCRETETDDGARREQAAEIRRHGKARAAQGRYAQKPGLHLARPVAVEQHAERQLEKREGAEIGRRQQTQLGR